MIYPYKCGHCGLTYERICSLQAYVSNPSFACPRCTVIMARMFTPPRIFTKTFKPFKSPVDGTIITSARELSEHNKRNRVVQLHEGYDEKAVQALIHKDLYKDKDEERRKDLSQDMKKSVQKLEEGYTPSPAPYTEEFPDADA